MWIFLAILEQRWLAEKTSGNAVCIRTNETIRVWLTWEARNTCAPRSTRIIIREFATLFAKRRRIGVRDKHLSLSLSPTLSLALALSLSRSRSVSLSPRLTVRPRTKLEEFFFRIERSNVGGISFLFYFILFIFYFFRSIAASLGFDWTSSLIIRTR